MAGAWIKMRMDLQTHPKVVRIASALSADKYRVIGGLHAVWSVFDAHCEDGRLNGYTPEAMDSIIGWPGFSAAMQSVDWLVTADGPSLLMPRFDEHNGASAKRRADDAERKRRARASEDRPPPVPDLSAPDADTKRTREREREREEVRDRNPSDSLSGKAPDVPPARPSAGIPPNGKTVLNKQAVAVLDFLNRVTGSKFQPVDANVRPARARVMEFGVDRVKAVIAAKAEEWRGDEKMEQYLRPATLFAASNFANYEGQTPRHEEAVNG
jgi:uncharacterized phage protein (TIGR02220 family)